MPTLPDAPTAPPQHADRRLSERLAVDRGCKLFVHDAIRFCAGRSVDVSRVGALVRCGLDRPVTMGQRVDLAMDWDRHGLVGSEQLVPGRVVRVELRPGGVQQLGIAFDHAIELKAVA